MGWRGGGVVGGGVNVPPAAYGHLRTITSGRITHSALFYTSSNQKYINHKFVKFCVILLNEPTICLFMHGNTCFGTYLYFVGTSHGNLFVTISRVTIILFR